MYINMDGQLLCTGEPDKVTFKQNVRSSVEQDAQGCLQCVWLFSIVKHNKGKSRMLVTNIHSDMVTPCNQTLNNRGQAGAQSALAGVVS